VPSVSKKIEPVVVLFRRDLDSVRKEMSSPIRNRDPKQVVSAIRRIDAARKAALEKLKNIKAA